MKLLNYTTEIKVEKTASEISMILAQGKAQAILTEYDQSGNLAAISFRAMTPFGIMSFRLPGNVDKVFMVLQRTQGVPRRLQTKEQASRVAWRIIKDWIEAQMALIKVQMVTLEQVFLPYAQDNRGNTLYETLRDSKFSGLALPPERAA